MLWYFAVAIWFTCIKTKRKDNDDGNTVVDHKRAHRITYEIIIEAAVNVLLIGLFKTVANMSMNIFDCTSPYDRNGESQMSMLIMDVDVICPHTYFQDVPGSELANPTPAIMGASVFFFWCILPFLIINFKLLQAVRNAKDGGLTVEGTLFE